jgi:hypothetical protein
MQFNSRDVQDNFTPLLASQPFCVGIEEAQIKLRAYRGCYCRASRSNSSPVKKSQGAAAPFAKL